MYSLVGSFAKPASRARNDSAAHNVHHSPDVESREASMIVKPFRRTSGDSLAHSFETTPDVEAGQDSMMIKPVKENCTKNLGIQSGVLYNFNPNSDHSLEDKKKNKGVSSIDTVDTKPASWILSGAWSLKKVLSKSYGDDYARLKADFIEEMRTLSKLRHPCITTVMGAVIERNQEPMLVMEYMDHGSLFDLLHNDTVLLEGEVLLPILKDIAQGVRFLHAATPQVIHGDLKAANVLVDSKFRAKVADFGLSQKKKVGATGTPFWMAPELLRGESDNTSASDIYAFGIILYEVYSRKVPYEGEDFHEVVQQVCDPEVDKRPPIPEAMPLNIQVIMSDCLVRDPSSRPKSEELDNRLRRLDATTVQPGDMHLTMQMKKMHGNEGGMDYGNFPQHIAEAIQTGRKIEPEHHDIVTIYFSDIVGYTDMCSILTPVKISDLLDRLYNKFDALSDKYEVFKIETIGDAYMAVSNLVKEQPEDHVKRIAEFARETVEAANQTVVDVDDPSMGFVNIRAGFHSGPVVSNVVGSRNLKFSIFGDTVNVASRMESNSIKNRIHCSDRAAKLLMRQAPLLPLICRGSIKIKGKGEMVTYFVGYNSEPEETETHSGEPSLDAHKVRFDTNINDEPNRTAIASQAPELTLE